MLTAALFALVPLHLAATAVLAAETPPRRSPTAAPLRAPAAVVFIAVARAARKAI